MQIVENQPLLSDEGSVAAPALQFGPTPDGFSELQGRWLDAMLQLGGRTKDAAVAAGYGAGGAENMGIRNLANPKLQAELVRRVKLQSGSALATAIGRLLKIIETSEDDKAAVQAAIAVAHMFGLAPPKGPAVQINQLNMNGQQANSIIAEVMKRRDQRLSTPQTAHIEHVASSSDMFDA